MHSGQEDHLTCWRVEYGFPWHFRGKCSTDYMGPSEVSSSAIVMLPLFQQPETVFRASPPRYSLLLFAMDPAVLWWPWIATMFYSHKIFLPDLIATMVGIATVCQWTVGIDTE